MTTRSYGGGETGLLFARFDGLMRQEDEEARQQARAVEAEQREAYETERTRGNATQVLVAVSLEALGFGRLKRGKWRKRRTMNTLPSPTTAPPTPARIAALVKEVKAKVPGALRELRAIAMTHPDMVVKETFTDLVKLAIGTAVNDVFPDNPAMQEGLRAKLRLIIAELAGDAPGPARRLCVEAVAHAWCEYWHVSTLISANAHLQTSREWLRRQSGSHRRLMTSLRTLSQIAAAERPRQTVVATQVNIH